MCCPVLVVNQKPRRLDDILRFNLLIISTSSARQKRAYFKRYCRVAELHRLVLFAAYRQGFYALSFYYYTYLSYAEIVYEKVATSDGTMPALIAFALMVVAAETVICAVYLVDELVGSVPSVV